MSISWCDFIAGSAAGVCGLLIGHPADTVKVRQQIFRSSGSIHIAIQTMRHEGLHGFYKGMGFPLLTSGALNSLFFGVYGNSLRALESSHKQHNPDNSEVSKYWYTNVFLAGAFAGTVQVAVATPIELVKIQLQSQTGTWEKQHLKKYMGPTNCILHIFNEHGLRGLYHGSQIMLYRYNKCIFVYVHVVLLYVMNILQSINFQTTGQNYPGNSTILHFITLVQTLTQESTADVVTRLQPVRPEVPTVADATDFSVLQNVQTNYRALSASYSMGTWGSFHRRDCLSSGLYVLTYAACLDFLHGPEHVWTVIFAGGTAGVISWASIMPLDVIKSRIQADNLSNPEYKGIVDCTIKSYKKDGLRVFGRGFVMCSFRSFLVNAATFLGYEWSLRFCQRMASRTQGYITYTEYRKEGKLTKISPEIAATK